MSLTLLQSNHARQFRQIGKAYIPGASSMVQWDDYLESMTRFATKEEYLAWRSAWKLDYATLTQEIRQAKRGHKLPDDAPRYFDGIPRCERHLKNIAYLMLLQRAYAKQKAQAQYLAAKLPV